MKKNGKRRSRRAQEAHRAQSMSAVGGPALPPALAIFAWLLNPEQREAMRRRFIDGKGGTMERWIWKFAYSRPLAVEHGVVGMRFMTVDQHFRGEGALAISLGWGPPHHVGFLRLAGGRPPPEHCKPMSLGWRWSPES